MKSRFYHSIFLLFLILVSPLAFATELKLVKVSDLKEGDIVVDKNGNEILVSSLQTQERLSKTISEVIKEKVFGNSLEASNNLDNQKVASFSPSTGSGQNGFGLALTGNAIGSYGLPADLEFYKNRDGFDTTIVAVDNKKNIHYFSEDSGETWYIWYSQEPYEIGEYLTSNGFYLDEEYLVSSDTTPVAATILPTKSIPPYESLSSPYENKYYDESAYIEYSDGSVDGWVIGNSHVDKATFEKYLKDNNDQGYKQYQEETMGSSKAPESLSSSDYKPVSEKDIGKKVYYKGQEMTIVGGSNGILEINDKEGATQYVKASEVNSVQLSSKGVEVTSKDQLRNYFSKSTLDSLSDEEFNSKYKGAKIIDGVVVSSNGEILSRGRVDTTFGNLNFGMGHIVQGATWAVVTYGLVQTLGGIFGSVSGSSSLDVDALSSAAAVGIFTGKLAYAGLGNGGLFGVGLNKDGTKNFVGRNSGVISGVIGAGVAWLTYNSMYKKEDQKIETVSFSCLPWQAPRGGADCELCNDGDLPCSEYRCKSLGQSCGLINVGTAAEQCVNKNPRDVNPPIIKPLDSALTDGLFYSDVKSNPPGAGFKIKSKTTTTGCIPPFKAFEFGIETNEPSQCKIDYESKGNYSDMASYFGGDNLYSYNHTEALSLPSSEDFKNSSIKLQNGKELNLFIRCRDSNGNTNEADYQLNICVDPSPDTTPPVVQATSINSGSCVAANSDNASIEFYVNEPSDCKWDFEDQEYSAMENNMSCSTSVKEINALQLYTCATTLTGIARDSTKFYVRCKDQPTNVEENKRNTNAESYIFSLRGSNPLKMKNIQPNGTIYGAVRPAPVELYVETLFGCDNNKAICYYSPTANENSFIQFFDTDKADGIHTQRLDLQDGLHNYYVKCVDSGGNLALNTTTFNLEIDTNAPVIARVYEEDDYLKLVTPRESECVFTNDGCDFLFEEGVQMPYANSTTHVTQWFADKNYYIKCRDEFRTEPTDCSLIVRPTDNFL